MKIAALLVLLATLGLGCARADLTIVQKVEGVGPTSEMTIKIKGDKARIDATPQLSTIVDRKTGEVINLMKDQKAVVRMSAEKMKAAADMISKYAGKKEKNEKVKLSATGKKETINGYEAEEYVCDTALGKATYWIAPKYPDGAAILKQLQTLKSEIWNPTNSNMPDYRDFPGLPIKTIMNMGDTVVTSTVTSVKQESLSDAEFAVPKDFKEVKAPDLGNLLENDEQKPASASPAP
jgi:hypothetical protein